MEERGIAQIIDTRRFSIPASQSIRLLVSRHLSCYCNCLKSSMSNYLHLLKLRESTLTLTSFPLVSSRGSDATVALLSGSGTAVDHGPP